MGAATSAACQKTRKPTVIPMNSRPGQKEESPPRPLQSLLANGALLSFFWEGGNWKGASSGSSFFIFRLSPGRRMWKSTQLDQMPMTVCPHRRHP